MVTLPHVGDILASGQGVIVIAAVDHITSNCDYRKIASNYKIMAYDDVNYRVLRIPLTTVKAWYPAYETRYET